MLNKTRYLNTITVMISFNNNNNNDNDNDNDNDNNNNNNNNNNNQFIKVSNLLAEHRHSTDWRDLIN